jgi:hypothetical protein
MKTGLLLMSIGLFLVGSVLAEPAVSSSRAAPAKKGEEKLVFVTGSLIPQRVKVRAAGTATVSPLRVIDRREIDHTGRFSTPGVFVNEPAVTIVGH